MNENCNENNELKKHLLRKATPYVSLSNKEKESKKYN